MAVLLVEVLLVAVLLVEVLLVEDMQRGPLRRPHDEYRAPNVKRLLEAFRERDWPVVWTIWGPFEPPDRRSDDGDYIRRRGQVRGARGPAPGRQISVG